MHAFKALKKKALKKIAHCRTFYTTTKGREENDSLLLLQTNYKLHYVHISCTLKISKQVLKHNLMKLDTGFFN